MAMRKLGKDLDKISVEGDRKPDMKQILACAQNVAENFTVDWIKNE